MLDPSVGVYRVHGKALKDGIVGWVTVAGNQGTLGWHVSYRAGWLANPWAILVYILYILGFKDVSDVLSVYEYIWYTHVYIHSWNIPTEKNTHLFTVKRLWKHTSLLPFHLYFENTTDWEAFQCLTGVVLITFGFVSPRKSGNRAVFWLVLKNPTIRLRNICIYIPGTWNPKHPFWNGWLSIGWFSPNHYIKKWLEITISIQLKTGKLWGSRYTGTYYVYTHQWFPRFVSNSTNPENMSEKWVHDQHFAWLYFSDSVKKHRGHKSYTRWYLEVQDT